MEADFLESLFETRQLIHSAAAAMPREADAHASGQPQHPTAPHDGTPQGTKLLLKELAEHLAAAVGKLPEKLAEQRAKFDELQRTAKVLSYYANIRSC